MAKNKYDFIKELLEDEKIKLPQRERIFELVSKELSIDGALAERVQEIEKIIFNKKSGFEDSEKQDSKNKAIHNPSKVTEYLKKFKENTALKFTTHIWDENKYATIQDFIDELNEDKSYSELYPCNRALYGLIQYFTYIPNQKLNEYGVPLYGWRSFPEIRIGWQFPNNLIIDWCKKNFDAQENKKSPFEYPLPKEFQPKKPIKGKMITTFENVVDVFKTEIQFRENYLFNEMKKRKAKMNDYEFIGTEKFENLDFYTYTSGVLSAIDTMLSEIKKNETAKTIHFEYRIEKEELIIDITQIDSFANRLLFKNNLLQFFGGGLNSIVADLISLCDFSVLSKFKDINNNELEAELRILHDGTEAVWEGKELKLITQPILKEITEEIKGFTYRLKFKI
jgi:hypothetical protein